MPISKDYNYDTRQYEGSCRFCGKRTSGRVTKKFCDQNCRVAYRNEINSFKRKHAFKSESEARNYFLLVRCITSRDLPITVRRINIDYLGIDGFDFTIPYTKYVETENAFWFKTGNLYFKVNSEKGEINARHETELTTKKLTKANKISLKDAFPELILRTRRKVDF